jgi:hypothetical protein
MPNIQLNYLYRCGGNYKNYGEVIFSNPEGLTLEDITQQITDKCIDGLWFYAHLCHIPTLFFDKYSPELDHPFHEYESVEHTHLPSTDARSIRQFVAAIKS